MVEPEDVWVLEQDGEERVTLVSDENGGKERLVVTGQNIDKREVMY